MPISLNVSETTLDGDTDEVEVRKPDLTVNDADEVRPPSVTLTSASYFDDWLHRGADNLLSDLPWYVYALWVYRAERVSEHDERSNLYLDIDFAPEYKLADAYVQRISLSLRVPQLEGMTLPTALQDQNANAMYKSLLCRPFHPLPIDRTTGELSLIHI